MLRPAYNVAVADRWDGERRDVMVALHARRSAESIRTWKAAAPNLPVLVALTGTDLYRDIDTDAAAQDSLDLADALVVLNELGIQRLPAEVRHKTHVILQSCTSRRHLGHMNRRWNALMVGHLREEKDPRTYWRAAQRLVHRTDIHLDHVGSPLDTTLGAEATALSGVLQNFNWLGGLSHAATRRRIQLAHVLVHCSRLEGGAHAIIEAVRSGTPVLASRIDGNVGLLGDDYQGLFCVGDDAGLAGLVERVNDDVAYLARLSQQIALRAPLFTPAVERAAVQRLIGSLIAMGAAPGPSTQP